MSPVCASLVAEPSRAMCIALLRLRCTSPMLFVDLTCRRHAEVPPHSGAWEERRPTLPSAYLPAQQLSSPSAARDKKPAQSEGRIAEDPKVAAWPAQQASHRPAHPAAAAAGSQQHAQRQSRSRERSSWSPQRYHVVVRTASARQSRTNGGDARLWLVMHGTRGSGGRHPLDLHDAGWAGCVDLTSVDRVCSTA